METLITVVNTQDEFQAKVQEYEDEGSFMIYMRTENDIDLNLLAFITESNFTGAKLVEHQNVKQTIEVADAETGEITTSETIVVITTTTYVINV